MSHTVAIIVIAWLFLSWIEDIVRSAGADAAYRVARLKEDRPDLFL